ncbi:MAG: hypothetical protein JST82_11375 [Bacteroidetes bacterium]|nr:hypothetical protein [Bacteroidota bacterium]
MKKLILAAGLLYSGIANAQYRTPAQQIITNEDSLASGISKKRTVISGYGSAYYQHNSNAQRTIASLDRVVLFVGHQFNSRIAFFSEMELENALVEGLEEKGEISMEQAFLKFNINSKNYIVAGLFLPRIGMLNENHLPVNFNGVERPMVEQLVIPATWREIGIGYYGSLSGIPLNYTVGLMNGLNSAGFEHGTGIREGRAEGSFANANNMAVSAAVQYNVWHLKFQLAGYAGGTVGLNKRGADSLGLNSGMFGTPIYLGEGDVQFAYKGITAKLLGSYISFPEADKINTAYGLNTASGMYGAYGELGYNVLRFFRKKGQSQLVAFARYEMIDLNSSIPAAPNAIYDGTLKQSHLIAGFSYLPIPNVVIKADVRLMNTGNQNPALVINPAPNALPYQTNNTFLNVGIGYSF